MKHDRQFFVVLGHFLPFYPTNNQNNQNFEKTSGDIIILLKCAINENHMMYGSWDTKWTDRIFCRFGPFLPYYPTNSPKIKIKKKWKNRLEMLSFYISVPKIMIVYYTFPVIQSVTDVIVISRFGLFFALLPL